MAKSKRKRSVPKSDSFVVMTSEEATFSQMPKYNAYAGGYGAHGDRRYNRRAEKERLRRDLKDGW